MDENYLDQLLKNVENEVMTEEELESPNPSISELVIPETEPELEETLARDAENIQDVAWADSEIPVEELSELDQLDELADVDMNSMDFDDIDFDDVDITKMKMDPVPFEKEMEDLSELNIDESYLDESEDSDLEQALQNLSGLERTEDGYVDTLSGGEGYIDTLTEPSEASSASSVEEIPDVSMDPGSSGDAEDLDLDSLINEVFSDAGSAGENPEAVPEPEEKKAETEPADQKPLETSSVSDDNENMEELFAMLGIEGNPDTSTSIPETDEIPDFEIPPELADVPDISEKKKKKNRFLDILFGDDDEDELTPEQEAELARKKEEKLQAKLEKKEQKKAQKAENDAKRKSVKEGKSAKLAEKKAARKAEDEKLLAEEGPDKKLNKILVALVMIFFFSIGGFIILGTNIFDYTLAITKTTDYFQRQKYGMAYREILGVEVKEQDQELEDKVYTVMYVERQYEAYENYMRLDQPDQALNALVQGLGKYDDYYEDAKNLGIVEDLNNARGKIISALSSVYNLSAGDALALLSLDTEEYSRQIEELSAGVSFSTEVDNTAGDGTE